MLEADAAMKSIVRKDTGDSWKTYLKGLAETAGLENPSDEELQRFDKNRPDKTVSNEDWKSPTDPDARIAKRKDGTTHLAYKAEHVVDPDSEVLFAAVVCHANHGDRDTLVDSVMQVKLNLDAVKGAIAIREAVADKGYHKAATLELCQALNVRTYIPERMQRHQSRWTDKPPEFRQAVSGNCRRVRGARSKRLQRLRSERVERSFAHVCETGSARHCWLHRIANVSKRYLLQIVARNLGLILRKLFGVGTPQDLQRRPTLPRLCILLLTRPCALSAYGFGSYLLWPHRWASPASARSELHRPRENTVFQRTAARATGPRDPRPGNRRAVPEPCQERTRASSDMFDSSPGQAGRRDSELRRPLDRRAEARRRWRSSRTG